MWGPVQRHSRHSFSRSLGYMDEESKFCCGYSETRERSEGDSMSLGAAASIGMQVYKHRQQIGAALQGINGLGQLAQNPMFGKILGKLESGLSNTTNSSSQPGGTNTITAMGGLAFFDADHNGQLTQQELTTGLSKLSTSGLDQNTTGKLSQLGQKMLQNYQKVAALDGTNNSISFSDISRLGTQDGQWQNISDADWQKVLA